MKKRKYTYTNCEYVWYMHFTNSMFSLSCSFFISRPQMEEFLATLLHFQHFRQFINHKIDQLKNQSVARDLFDKESMLYDEGTVHVHVHAMMAN